MYRLLISCLGCIFLILTCNRVYSQYETSSAGGEWSDASYWVGSSAPPYTGVSPDVIITHRNYSNSSVVFADGGNNKDQLVVNDTLIIYGNLTLGSFDDVTIGANGLLIIFGDFTAQNQVNIANGGYLVVLGDFYLPQGGTSFGNIDTARTYIVGDVDIPNSGADDLDCDPDINTDCGYGDGSDLFEDPIFEFINEISDQTCSISLSAAITDESSVGAADGAIDISLAGASNPSFAWSNDSTTQNISGLSAGDYALVVFDGTCVIDTSFTLTSSCTDPTATIVAASDTICDGDNITLTITFTAGTAPFDFTIVGGVSPDSLTNISANPYSYIPGVAPVWADLGSNVNTSYTYTISTITDANTCTNTNQGSETITVVKVPETGPQHHIENAWEN